jgi:hypothetical protein
LHVLLLSHSVNSAPNNNFHERRLFYLRRLVRFVRQGPLSKLAISVDASILYEQLVVRPFTPFVVLIRTLFRLLDRTLLLIIKLAAPDILIKQADVKLPFQHISCLE